MKKIILGGSIVLMFAFGLASIVSAEVNGVTPSTNDINRTNGWAHVDQISVGVGTIDLNFISTRAFWSCFEYRRDNESNTVNGVNPNPVITDGRWTQVCLNNSQTTKTIQADEFVDVRMVYGAETDERFDWTRFEVLPPPFVRTAEITSPAEGAEVSGSVLFSATLNDKDGNDNVQWAVRKGTCVAGTNTVAGNVDGNSTPYIWTNGASFSSTIDVSPFSPGDYCFIFNPTESAGDTPIRLTRNFIIIDPDSDDDGVLNEDDLCPNTTKDEFSNWKESQGRYKWDGEKWVSSGKGAKSFLPTIEGTLGCSGTQILNIMKEKTGLDFGGHYKFGLTKGIIEDWMAGEYYMGKKVLETVEVPAISSIPTESDMILESGKDYSLKAYGTANAGDTIDFDAQYSITNKISGDTWTDDVSGYLSYGTGLLDLFVDGLDVDWGSFVEGSHEYTIPYTGTGSKLSLLINDVYYPNNIGSLSVDIIGDWWVSLW